MLELKLLQDVQVYQLQRTHVVDIEYKINIKNINQAIRKGTFHDTFKRQDLHGHFVEYTFNFVPLRLVNKYVMEEYKDGEKETVE